MTEKKEYWLLSDFHLHYTTFSGTQERQRNADVLTYVLGFPMLLESQYKTIITLQYTVHLIFYVFGKKMFVHEQCLKRFRKSHFYWIFGPCCFCNNITYQYCNFNHKCNKSCLSQEDSLYFKQTRHDTQRTLLYVNIKGSLSYVGIIIIINNNN